MTFLKKQKDDWREDRREGKVRFSMDEKEDSVWTKKMQGRETSHPRK